MSVSKGEYKGVMQIITMQIEKTNKHWHKASDKGASQKLDSNLLIPNLHFPGMMDINFDRNLIKLIKEVPVLFLPSHLPTIVRSASGRLTSLPSQATSRPLTRRSGPPSRCCDASTSWSSSTTAS
jgi:hypothetical protein